MRWKFTLPIVLGFMALLVLSLNLINHLAVRQAMDSNYVSDRLQNVTGQVASNISDFALGNLQTLETAGNMTDIPPEPSEQARLKNIAQSLGFSDINICRPNGMAVDLAGTSKRVGFCPYYSKALDGNASVALTKFNENDPQESVVYSVPVKSGGAVVGVLRARQDPALLRKALHTNAFSGKEQVYLLLGSGKIILTEDGSPPPQESFLNMVGEDKTDLSELSQTIRQGHDVVANGIMVHGSKSSMAYSGVDGVNEWGVMLYLPTADLNDLYGQKSNLLDKSVPYLFVLGVAAIAVLLIMLLRELGKNQRAEKLAYRDPVTGSLTIVGFRKEFDGYRRNVSGGPCALIQIGIDNYDAINDFFGGQEINRLLSAIAGVLRQNVKSDGIFCKANMKYFYLLMHYQSQNELDSFISYLDDLLMQCNMEKDKNIKYSLSFHYGVYCLSPEDSDINSIMERVRQAFVRIKDNPVQTVAYYSENNRKQIISNNEVYAQIQSALEEKEFVVYFQPVFDLNTGGQAACEALVRWMHPQKGIIYPVDFIAALEQKGLSVELDRYILESVCIRLKAWMSKGYRLMPVSVNISRVNLYDSDFEKNLLSIVEKYGVPPSLIKLEITEEIFSLLGEVAAKVVRRIKEHGFLISMDNFGTGQTSMDTFYRVPLDELKIDRKFLLGAGKTSKGQEAIQGIISMTKNLSVKVVSEGVENTEQAKKLRELGCAMMQGYVFCEPLPAREYENYAYGPQAKNNRVII